MSLCILVARITIETGGVESALFVVWHCLLCIICRMAVVSRVDTRFDSSIFLQLFTFFQFYFLSYFLSFFILSLFFAMTVLKAIVSLYRAGEKKPIEGHKTMIKVMEENTLFSSFQKNIIEFLGLNERAQKFWLRSFDLKFYRLRKSMAKQRITPFQHSSNWSWNCLSCLAQMGEAS